jgi:hypothetical protein
MSVKDKFAQMIVIDSSDQLVEMIHTVNWSHAEIMNTWMEVSAESELAVQDNNLPSTVSV